MGKTAANDEPWLFSPWQLGKIRAELVAMSVTLGPLWGKALTVPSPSMWGGTTTHLRFNSNEASFTFRIKPVYVCHVCGSLLVRARIGIYTLCFRNDSTFYSCKKQSLFGLVHVHASLLRHQVIFLGRSQERWDASIVQAAEPARALLSSA